MTTADPKHKSQKSHHSDKNRKGESHPVRVQKNSSHHPVKTHRVLAHSQKVPKTVKAHKKAVTLSHRHRHHPAVAKTATKSWLKRWWVWAVSAVVLIAVVLGFRGHEAKMAQKNHKGGPPAVPVAAEQAHKGDIGVYLEAIGAVTPISTVTLTSRVQGQIMKIAYNEGQLVHKDDLLIEIDPRPYEAALMQAEGQLARDTATLNKDRINLTRYQQAYKSRAISKQQLDDQGQTVLQDEGAVKTDEGNVETAQVNLTYCHITAPIDGRVGLRLVDVGNIVQATSPTNLAVLTQMQPIDVAFSIPEDSLSAVQEQLANSQSMKVDAYDRTQEKKIAEGAFFSLDNQIDPATGTVKIKAVFDNKNGELFPNQFVNVRLLVTTQHDAILVPSQAIQRNNQGPYVYVIKQDQTAELRQIKTGPVDGDKTAVTGLQDGETIATNGFDKLQEGVKVSVKKPDSAPPAPAASRPSSTQPAADQPTVLQHQAEMRL